MVCKNSAFRLFTRFCFHLETNIDEILSLPDLSGVPTAFLTEIEQDEAYKTIYQELQKKIPHTNRSSSSPPLATLPAVLESDEHKPLSPHLTTEGQNDDDNNINDEVSSSTSNEDSLSSSSDGYDTDIETGERSNFESLYFSEK